MFTFKLKKCLVPLAFILIAFLVTALPCNAFIREGLAEPENFDDIRLYIDGIQVGGDKSDLPSIGPIKFPLDPDYYPGDDKK